MLLLKHSTGNSAKEWTKKQELRKLLKGLLQPHLRMLTRQLSRLWQGRPPNNISRRIERQRLLSIC